MSVKHTGRSLMASLGTILLGVGLLTVGTAANAAPGDGGDGSITVHKFAQPDTDSGLDNDGSELDSSDLADLEALKDVGFTVVPIEGLDLSEAGNWDKLKDLDVTLGGDGAPVLDGVAGASLGSPGAEVKTGLDGSAAFTGLPADKAYVVYESTPPKDVSTTSEPSIVTLPYPGVDSEAWNYAVHVYPKNAVTGLGSSKTATVIGNKITFDISYRINNLGIDSSSGDPIKYTTFFIEDQLGTGLTYEDSKVQLVENNAASDIPGTEYSIDDSSNNLKLEFITVDNDGVLTYLQNNIGKTIKWSITVTAGPAATSVANTAKITVNNNEHDATVPDPQDLINGVYIKKEAETKNGNTPAALPGAGFEIWTMENAAQITACPDYGDLGTSASELQKVDTGTLTSGTDGKTAEIVLAAGDYCVYETEVPAGYKGQVDGTKFTVNSANDSVTITNKQFGTDSGDLPGLPVTGATGRVLLAVAGVALGTLAIGLYLVRRHRLNKVNNS